MKQHTEQLLRCQDAIKRYLVDCVAEGTLTEKDMETVARLVEFYWPEWEDDGK